MASDSLSLETVFAHLTQEARDTRSDVRELRDDVHRMDGRLGGIEHSLQQIAEHRRRSWKLRREVIIAGAAAAVGRWSDRVIAVAAAVVPHHH